MKNKKSLIIKICFIIVLVILFIILGFCLKNIYDSLNEKTEVKTLSSIDKYNYSMNESDSPYFQEQFKKLENCLNEKEIDEELYASLVGKLFVIDFYSLQYAMSKSDVGGIQFIPNDNKEAFSLKAKDTMYNYVESNIYGKREQVLPNVTKVEVEEIKTDKYKGDLYKDDEAYYLDINIEYEEDLDYPNKVSLIIIHNNDKLEIVKVK